MIPTRCVAREGAGPEPGLAKHQHYRQAGLWVMSPPRRPAPRRLKWACSTSCHIFQLPALFPTCCTGVTACSAALGALPPCEAGRDSHQRPSLPGSAFAEVSARHGDPQAAAGGGLDGAPGEKGVLFAGRLTLGPVVAFEAVHAINQRYGCPDQPGAPHRGCAAAGRRRPHPARSLPSPRPSRLAPQPRRCRRSVTASAAGW